VSLIQQISSAMELNDRFSAGNDAAIICHDLETASTTSTESPGRPTEVWIDNDDSIHGLSCHPSNPHLFISASSDGTLRQYDTRTTSAAVGILADAHKMEGVQSHPLQHELFAYAGEDAHSGLIDSRMAWTNNSSHTNSGPNQRLARNVAVVNFEAKLVRFPASTTNGQPRTQRARPAVSSLNFSPTGSLICLTLSGNLPTLYSLSSPSPLATFSAPVPSPSDSTRPEGFPKTYRNACTTKHGSFGGGPDAKEGQGLYYAAGSDDLSTAQPRKTFFELRCVNAHRGFCFVEPIDGDGSARYEVRREKRENSPPSNERTTGSNKLGTSYKSFRICSRLPRS